MTFHRERFAGEASTREVARLAGLAKTPGTTLIVGLGGGKALDTAKAVADELSSPVAIVPTIASTDAPCSALSVIYSDDGMFEKYRDPGRPRHPRRAALLALGGGVGDKRACVSTRS